MSSPGNFTPGFAEVIAGSFHLVILPRKIPARASGVKFKSRLHAGNIVAGDVGAQDRGEMQNRHAGLLELIVIHRAVGGAEIHSLVQQLADAAAGTDRLVVDLHVRDELVILDRTTWNKSDRGTSRRRRSAKPGPSAAGKRCNGQQNCKHAEHFYDFAFFLLEVHV